MQIIFLSLFLLLGNIVFANEHDKMALMELGYTSDNASKLLAGERLSADSKHVEELFFMPKTALVNSIRQSLIAKSPSTLLEAAYYLPGLTGATETTLYNNIIDISSLEGLTFFSRSENKEKILVYEAYKVDKIGSKTPLKVERMASIPNELSFMMRQNEETFDVAYYNVLVNYDKQSKEISIRITNETTLKKGGVVKMAGSGDMQTTLIAIPLSNGLLFYGLASNVKSAPSFIKNKMNQSLTNRIDAFKNWFVSRYKAS